MSDPRFYRNNSERYIKFHTYFLTEYADIIRMYPKSGLIHYESLILHYFSVGKNINALDMWKQLLRIKFNFRSLALYPYFLFRNIFRKIIL